MKRQIAFVISCGFFVLDQVRRIALRAVGRHGRGSCVVLMYHEVPSRLRARFARQMDIALEMATPLAADHDRGLEPSGRYFVVTFDDGLRSVAENAVPELEKRQVPATIFVVTGAFGEVPEWTSHSKGESWAYAERSEDRMLTADQIRGLKGRVLVGSHSVTHPRLTDIEEDKARFELEDSRRRLNDILGDEVTMFSFPYGACSEAVLGYCRDAGYERVFTNLPGFAFSDPNEFVSGRIAADPRDGLVEFRLKLVGAYRWLPAAFAAKRRLRSLFRSRTTPVPMTEGL